MVEGVGTVGKQFSELANKAVSHIQGKLSGHNLVQEKGDPKVSKTWVRANRPENKPQTTLQIGNRNVSNQTESPPPQAQRTASTGFRVAFKAAYRAIFREGELKQELHTIKNSHDTWNNREELTRAVEDIEMRYSSELISDTNKEGLDSCKERISTLLDWEITDIERGFYDNDNDKDFHDIYQNLDREIEQAPIPEEQRDELRGKLEKAVGDRTNRNVMRELFNETAQQVREKESWSSEEIESLKGKRDLLMESESPEIRALGKDLSHFIDALEKKEGAQDIESCRAKLLANELNYVFSQPGATFQSHCTTMKKEMADFRTNSLFYSERDFPAETDARITSEQFQKAQMMHTQLTEAEKSKGFRALQKKLTSDSLEPLEEEMAVSEANFQQILSVAMKKTGNSSWSDKELIEKYKSDHKPKEGKEPTWKGLSDEEIITRAKIDLINQYSKEHPTEGWSSLAMQLSSKNTQSGFFIRNTLNNCIARDRNFVDGTASKGSGELSTPAIHEQCIGELKTPAKHLETLMENNRHVAPKAAFRRARTATEESPQTAPSDFPRRNTV